MMENGARAINLEEENCYSTQTQTVIRNDEQCNMLKAQTSSLLNTTRYGSFKTTSINFSCINNKNILWLLELVENAINDNYISLNLFLKNSDIPVLQVFLKCTLTKATKNIRSVSTIFCVGTSNSRSMTIPKFIEKKLLSPKRLISQFNVICKIYALPYLSLNRKTEQITSDLSVLLEEAVLADVTLIASEKEIKAHKAILAARSPVFAKMFQHDMREKQESRVYIDDIEYEVLQAFVRFAYTDRLEGNCEAMAGALIVAAEKYQFEELRKASANLLLQRLNVANAISTLELADRHSYADLKSKVIEFINSHAKDIVKTPAFKALSEKQAHLIVEIYSVMAMAVNFGKKNSIKRIDMGRYKY